MGNAGPARFAGRQIARRRGARRRRAALRHARLDSGVRRGASRRSRARSKRRRRRTRASTPAFVRALDAARGRSRGRRAGGSASRQSWTTFAPRSTGRSLRRHDPAVGLELLADIEWPELIATPHEALRWFEAALAHEDAMPGDLVHARLLRHCVILLWLTGRPTAHREKLALRAVEIARRAGDPDEVAHALGYLGTTYAHAARFDEAERSFAQAYATPEQPFASRRQTRFCACGPSSNLQRGDLDHARRRFLRSRAAWNGPEAKRTRVRCSTSASSSTQRVTSKAARNAARQAKESYARLNSVYTALALANLAAYAMEAGDLHEARDASVGGAGAATNGRRSMARVA